MFIRTKDTVVILINNNGPKARFSPKRNICLGKTKVAEL